MLAPPHPGLLTSKLNRPYLDPMVCPQPDSPTIVSRLIAACLIVAILFVGIDAHRGRDAPPSHHSDIAASLTSDHDSAPASDHAIGGDHYCHSCVVLVAIDGDARQLHAKNPVLVAFIATVLLGMMAAPPGRPPRTTLPVT